MLRTAADLFAGQSEPSTGWQFKIGQVGALIVRARHLEAVKKWDWLRAETAKTPENQRSRRCLSQFFQRSAILLR
jgi:hypothetical protein